jgi:hypothetical protein
MKAATAFARNDLDGTRLATAVPSATGGPKLVGQFATVTSQSDGAHGSATRTNSAILFVASGLQTRADEILAFVPEPPVFDGNAAANWRSTLYDFGARLGLGEFDCALCCQDAS